MILEYLDFHASYKYKKQEKVLTRMLERK